MFKRKHFLDDLVIYNGQETWLNQRRFEKAVDIIRGLRDEEIFDIVNEYHPTLLDSLAFHEPLPKYCAHIEISLKGPIPFYQWMWAVLYGQGGYYSSGTAVINKKSGSMYSFDTMIQEESTVKSIISLLDQSFPKDHKIKIVYISGDGTFERRFAEQIEAMNIHSDRFLLLSTDVSINQLKKHTAGNQRILADATEFIFRNVDVVFCNELISNFSQDIIQVDESNRIWSYYVDFKGERYHTLIKPVRSSINIENWFRLFAISRKFGHLPFDNLYCLNPGQVSYLTETSKAISGSQFLLHMDYAGSNDQTTFRDDISFLWQRHPFQNRLTMRYQNLFEDFSTLRRYAPYNPNDVTGLANPAILRTVGGLLGLNTRYFNKHANFVKEFGWNSIAPPAYFVMVQSKR